MTSPGSNSWRSAAAIRTSLVAALVGAVAVGSYGLASQSQGNGATAEGASATEEASPTTTVAPFTTADAGTCLTWSLNADGEIEQFERADCEGEHRFEVSTREDLATYPTSEFGADAERPGITRQAQLREELCEAPTLRYLDGQFDPAGRYTIASILPPEDKWAEGDRTLLCGLQSTDGEGNVLATSGYVAQQDQARTFEPGDCVAIDSADQLSAVECSEPHQLEVTETVDLNPVFENEVPDVEKQDEHLLEACTAAGEDYVGGGDKLREMELTPYWIPVPPASWAGGSRSTNCYLVHAHEEGGFSVLTGSAVDPENFQVDEAAPAEEPSGEASMEQGPAEAETGDSDQPQVH